LRTKGIDAVYLESGANGWVQSGGEWSGEINFTSVYTDDRYKRLFTLSEIEQAMADGVVIIDAREPERYDDWHIPGSINIPIIRIPSTEMDSVLSQVSAGAQVITVCDQVVNCFGAKVTGVKLEKYGHEFLGRYNKPWEYRNTHP
jgi:3-mercaptopyruvate sulfurtransferase SseA